MALTLDQKLKFEFSNLKYEGSNIDEFYIYRYHQYRLEFSELPKKAKIRAITRGKLFGKSKIYIDKVLSERTFIQDQIVKCTRYLNEPINLDNREKLNLWIDYLKNKKIYTYSEVKEEPEINENFPPLPDCFKIKGDFEKYFLIPQITDLYDINRTHNTYHLKSGKKASLACLASELLSKGKFINTIVTNQDLAKVFCTFFHVRFNPKGEKQFQPDRINQVNKKFYRFIKGLSY